MTDSRGCEHEGTKVETASNRLNGVADPEGATAGAAAFTSWKFIATVERWRSFLRGDLSFHFSEDFCSTFNYFSYLPFNSNFLKSVEDSV